MNAARQARRTSTATREPTGGWGDGLRLTDESKTYRTRRGTVNALAPVTLDVAAGSLVAVVGRSGCGKSTLLRIMAGPTEPTAGAVEIGGHAVDGPPPEARFMFQDYGNSLLAWRSVARNVRLGLEHSSASTGETPEHYLDLVGLDGVGDRYRGSSPEGCSSGSRSPGPWHPDPGCCSSTSRSARSTGCPGPDCRTSCNGCGPSWA